MCLGIPGEIVEFGDPARQLATVAVAGVRRKINVSLIEPDGIEPGDWVLIHVGFAMAKIDEEDARLALEALQLLGDLYVDEVETVRASDII